MAGLAPACVREPAPEAAPEISEVPKTRKAKVALVSPTPPSYNGAFTAVWVAVTFGVLALGAVILVGSQIRMTNHVQSLA